MAFTKAENNRIMNKIAKLYTEGRTKLEICRMLDLKNARYNALFVEAQACGLLQFDPDRAEAYHPGKPLVEAIKKKLGASDDAIILIERYDEETLLIRLADDKHDDSTLDKHDGATILYHV